MSKVRCSDAAQLTSKGSRKAHSIPQVPAPPHLGRRTAAGRTNLRTKRPACCPAGRRSMRLRSGRPEPAVVRRLKGRKGAQHRSMAGDRRRASEPAATGGSGGGGSRLVAAGPSRSPVARPASPAARASMVGRQRRAFGEAGLSEGVLRPLGTPGVAFPCSRQHCNSAKASGPWQHARLHCCVTCRDEGCSSCRSQLAAADGHRGRNRAHQCT